MIFNEILNEIFNEIFNETCTELLGKVFNVDVSAESC